MPMVASGSIASISETEGATIALPSGSTLTKRNSVFTTWNALADGSGASYNAGDSFTVNGNETLFAQWSAPVLTTEFASPRCVSGVGVGGAASSTLSLTQGGDGCVVIAYLSSGTTAFKTFNYTGASQSWTVPAGVTSATFYLIGAGGGGVTQGTGTGTGGGGGFAREQLELHQVRPLKLLLVKQVAELFQQTQEDALTHQEHLAAAVKVAPAISFVQE
jgi:hypothetical protein